MVRFNKNQPPDHYKSLTSLFFTIESVCDWLRELKTVSGFGKNIHLNVLAKMGGEEEEEGLAMKACQCVTGLFVRPAGNERVY